ncbi:MAG: hypothetical protein ACKO8X_09375 [Verrucomicrobiota bacterium]
MSRLRLSARSGSVSRKLLTMLCGIALFLFLAGLLGVWALGRFSPRLLDASLSARTGARLAVEQNDTNLFVGRIAYAGLTITNPSRWQEREFLKVKRLVLDVDPLSFRDGGAHIVDAAELDIEHLTLASKADFFKDNNAQDIANGLKAGAGRDATKPAEPAGKQPFQIRRLRVRVGRVTVVNHDGAPDRRVFLDRQADFVFEAADVTEHNFAEKVTRPLAKEAMRVALGLPAGLPFDLSARPPK